MIQKSIIALVVSSLDDLQNGLLALMTTIPPISAVLVAEDPKSACPIIENHHPALIIMDLSLPKSNSVLKQIKTQWPQIHLIALADEPVPGKDMETISADFVLIKGFPPQKLIEVIEDLIAESKTK